MTVLLLVVFQMKIGKRILELAKQNFHLLETNFSLICRDKIQYEESSCCSLALSYRIEMRNIYWNSAPFFYDECVLNQLKAQVSFYPVPVCLQQVPLSQSRCRDIINYRHFFIFWLDRVCITHSLIQASKAYCSSLRLTGTTNMAAEAAKLFSIVKQ